MNMLLAATRVCIPASSATTEDDASDARYVCYESDPVQEDMQLAL